MTHNPILKVYGEKKSYPSGWMACPYMKSHLMVPGKSFGLHITECRKNALNGLNGKESHSEVENHWWNCPYNPTHIVHSSHFDKHQNICSDKYNSYFLFDEAGTLDIEQNWKEIMKLELLEL